MNRLLLLAIIFLFMFSIVLTFYWEGIVNIWLRLPIINLVVFAIIFVAAFIEQIYFMFKSDKSIKYNESSIYKRFFKI